MIKIKSDKKWKRKCVVRAHEYSSMYFQEMSKVALEKHFGGFKYAPMFVTLVQSSAENKRIIEIDRTLQDTIFQLFPTSPDDNAELTTAQGEIPT